MKYVVLTSRHHDGFSLFDTRASDYRITSAESPYGKDIVKPLADACHRAGLHFGIYYSQPDWHSPDAFTPQGHARYQAYLKAQLTELLSQFGAVDLLFFDGLSGTDADYDGAGLIALARRLQPQIIINNRTGLPADYDTPEQTIGGFQLDRPWETCMTLGDQWSYKPNDRIKSLETCIRTLARCAGGDGNLLLNVGPTPSGVIEPGQADRLREVGAWLAKHGESIYGTRGGPFPPTAAYVTTRAGRSVYVHVFEWQGDRVALPAIGARVVSASVLGGGAAACEATSEGLTLTVPASAHELIDTIIKLELDREAATLPPAVR